MRNSEKTMDKIVALCKNRGFIFSGSEIYGGLANTWDYGPLGVEFKNNIKRAWWKKFVQESPYNVGLDADILMNPRVWVASGHVTNFNDPLIDCKGCKRRHRADKLIEEWAKENGVDVNVEAMTNDQMVAYIREQQIPCPGCGKSDFSDIKKFNLMFKTHQGVTEDSGSDVYLRPETAQGIFVNFNNVLRTSRKKVPFGICQIGKSFRNEITPGNFTFRTCEFEQMELEFFCEPDTDLPLAAQLVRFSRTPGVWTHPLSAPVCTADGRGKNESVPSGSEPAAPLCAFSAGFLFFLWGGTFVETPFHRAYPLCVLQHNDALGGFILSGGT